MIPWIAISWIAISWIAVCLLLSALACGAYLQLARRWQILAQPNERSSHSLPTPHGGGIPALCALAVTVLAAGITGVHWPLVYPALLGMAALLLVVGVLDDHHDLPAGARFACYWLCCVVAVAWLYRALGPGIPAWLAIVAIMALLWFTNLYNFMDGIDGIAASQCVLATATAGGLVVLTGGSPEYALFCFLLGAAHAGFLLWNWPPARMFMGDAGSIPTGFLLGSLALLGAWEGDLPLACWLILLAAFITDTSVTLLWRIATGQSFAQPHRLHAYQRLSRVFGGHRPVLLILFALHAFWLIPLAAAAAILPQYALAMVILAYIPLQLGMAKALKVG